MIISKVGTSAWGGVDPSSIHSYDHTQLRYCLYIEFANTTGVVMAYCVLSYEFCSDCVNGQSVQYSRSLQSVPEQQI